MKALVKTRPGQGNLELRDVPAPRISGSDLLVKVTHTAICGTDVHIYDWNAWAAAHHPPAADHSATSSSGASWRSATA